MRRLLIIDEIFSTVFPVFLLLSLFNVMFTFNELWRSQYSYDNTMKNGTLKVGALISCWHSYARLLYWLCKVGRTQTEVGRTFETAKSQSSNHCQQRILQENCVPIRVLTTRACATLIALKFSFRANVPFLNHSMGPKTFRMMRVWTYTRTKTNCFIKRT